MPLTSVAAFWAMSMLFVLTPGADWAYAISSGLRNRSVVPAISGMLSGHLAATVVVAAGLGLLLTGDPMILGVLTVVGALYIGWLGVGMIREQGGGELAAATDTQGTAASSSGQFARGVGVSLLNPKVILLLGALLPPFASPDAALPMPAQMMVLGSVHVACTAVVYFAVGLLAARFLSGRASVAGFVTRLSGLALIIVAAVLLVRQAGVWM